MSMSNDSDTLSIALSPMEIALVEILRRNEAPNLSNEDYLTFVLKEALVTKVNSDSKRRTSAPKLLASQAPSFKSERIVPHEVTPASQPHIQEAWNLYLNEDSEVNVVYREGFIQDSPIKVDNSQPPLGLHNRDGPSIFCLEVLRKETQSKPIHIGEFTEILIKEAWRRTHLIEKVQREQPSTPSTKTDGRSMTALYPSKQHFNAQTEEELRKKAATERNFLSFAFGKIWTNREEVFGSGVLASWGAISAVMKNGDGPYIALTRDGDHLLKSMDGMPPVYPHEPHYGEKFLQMLKSKYPTDFYWLMKSLELVKEEPEKEQYESLFLNAGYQIEDGHLSEERETFHDWVHRDRKTGKPILKYEGKGHNKNPVYANPNGPFAPSPKCKSIAAGYIARGREWGLIEYRSRIEKRYQLTNYGRNVLKGQRGRQ
jgi:hypothetical protein